MNAEDIISEIEQYVSTPDTPFAVLLEGPWGCGKTRFVKNELAPALEELDDPCIVIRASMVGVVTADETFSRIATAAVCDYADIEADASRKRRKLVKKAAKKLRLSYLKAQADKILKTTGLSYSPSSDLITALLLPKRCLLVLDDVERRGEIDDLGFFGVVDSLVERFDKKVLIVHASEGDPLGEEITEKLVWNKFELTPDYEFICKSVFREAIGACSSLEVHAAVADGVKASGNKNIRMLIRVKPCLTKLFASAYANDESIDESIRHGTLADAVKYVVGSVAGELPTEPVAPTKGSDLGDVFSYQRQRAIWDKSNALRNLDALVKTGVLDDRDLSKCLRDYGAVYHPSSALEEEALRLAEEVKYCCMDDEDAYHAVNAI